MGKKPFKIEAEGVCPVCGAEGCLDYGTSEVEDNGLKYPWTCNECGATGEEWYDIAFSEHCNVTDNDGNEYGFNEDYTYEIMDANDNVLDTDYVDLDTAIEYAETNGGVVINKLWWSLDENDEKIDTTAVEVVWKKANSKELKCVACGAAISAEKLSTCLYCSTMDLEEGEPVFCSEKCVHNYYGIREVKILALKK